MGTRNATIVIKDNKTKVAQYGQWDGYPSGQGVTALNFLRQANLSQFGTEVDKLDWFTEEELEDLGTAWQDSHPYLSRDTGAEILIEVYKGTVTKLVNREDFVADSLFCEWAYVVDLDKNTFEVYEGFNQEPLTKDDRFFDLTENVERRGDNQYHPCKMIKSYPLDNLPTEEEFIEYFDKLEEEEAEEENTQD
jgi:hypothetical protein